MKQLQIIPIYQKEAFAFIKKYHRHHSAPAGSVFQIAVCAGENIVGVAVVGRPVARWLQDGYTLEVIRLCVIDGMPNACSMLYARCWKVTRELGYRKLITYTLNTEPGTSLKAAGWECLGERGGRSWSRPSRPRIDKHPLQKRILFEKNI